jgi:hypothetical protein
LRSTLSKSLTRAPRSSPDRPAAEEVAGFLGHKLEQFATTEIYARYAPDYRGAAIRAIDDFFRELSPLLARPLLGFELEDQPTPDDLRAQLRAQDVSPGSASD